MWRRVDIWVAMCVGGFFGWVWPAGAAQPSRAVAQPAGPAEELFVGTLRRMTHWFDGGRTNSPVVEADLEVLATQGFSAGLVGQKLRYVWRCPDRAQLSGRIGGEGFTLGRWNDELWLWRARQTVVWRGRSTAEDSLGPVALPWVAGLRPRLTSMFSVERLPAAAIGGVACEVLRGVTRPEAGGWISLPAVELTLWLGQRDQRLRRFRVVSTADQWAVTMGVNHLRETPPKEIPRWQAPTSSTNRVESVKLARIRGAFPEAYHELGLLSLVDW